MNKIILGVLICFALAGCTAQTTETAENATRGIIRAAEIYHGNQLVATGGSFNDGKDMKIDFSIETEASRLSYNGTKPNAGQIVIKSSGQVVIIKPLVFNNYFCGYKIGMPDSRVVSCQTKEAAVSVGS